MFTILNFLGSVFKTNKINIDNLIFKLHYKATFALFLATSVLVISKQLFGENINCLVDPRYKEIVNSFCWINSTFSLRSKYQGTIGSDILYPGAANDQKSDKNDLKYHKFYQWVSMLLAMQG